MPPRLARLIVAEPEPIAVGVVRVRAPWPEIVVVVKATFTFERAKVVDGVVRARLDDVQDPLLPTDLREIGAGPEVAARLEPDTLLTLPRPVRGGQAVRAALPDLAPFVVVDRPAGAQAPAMVADAVDVDVDREIISVTWRGRAPVVSIDRPGIRLIMAAMEPRSAPRSLDEIRRQLPHASFSYAPEAADLLPGAPALPRDDEHLRMARFATFGHPHAPDPRLSLEEYLAASAELAARPSERGAILARLGMDEAAFGLEDRAFGERLAAAAAAGDDAYLSQVAAQRARARRSTHGQG